MYTNPVPCPQLPASQRRIMFTKQAKGLSTTDHFDFAFYTLPAAVTVKK